MATVAFKSSFIEKVSGHPSPSDAVPEINLSNEPPQRLVPSTDFSANSPLPNATEEFSRGEKNTVASVGNALPISDSATASPNNLSDPSTLGKVFNGNSPTATAIAGAVPIRNRLDVWANTMENAGYATAQEPVHGTSSISNQPYNGIQASSSLAVSSPPTAHPKFKNFQSRPRSSGSMTAVEPVEYVVTRGRNDTPTTFGFRNPTPVLRLHVDSNTRLVSRDDTPAKSQQDTLVVKQDSQGDDKEKNATENGKRVNYSTKFVLKKPEYSATIRDNENYTEVYEPLSYGLSRGENASKDESWKERWLQQKSVVEQEDGRMIPQAFGRKRGESNALKQRWVEKWNNVGNNVSVNRVVTRHNDEDTRVEEEWFEDVEVDGNTGITTIRKKGEDRSKEVPRFWTMDIEYCDEREEEHGYRKEVYSEEEGCISRGYRNHKGKDGSYKMRNWCRNNEDGPNREEWVDEHFVDADGHRGGEKNGVNPHGEEWFEKWFERDTGDREIDKWAIDAAKGIRRGEKQGYSSDSKEEYNEKWVEYNSSNESNSFIDKWWSKPDENNKWGEKRNIRRSYTKADSPRSRELIREEVEEENWHDSSHERVNKVTVTHTEYGCSASSRERTIIRQVKKGSINGFRRSDEHSWGEEWSEVYEAPKEVEGSASGLFLRSRLYDKWWNDKDSKSSGEKCFRDFETDEEFVEHWYRNESEWQVDRWETLVNGIKKGAKFGSNKRGVSWEEFWKKDKEIGEEVVEKSWNERKERDLYQWGESSTVSAASRSSTKWNETSRDGGQNGDRWTKKWKDDGFGNVTTEKKGNSWRHNGQECEVTSWYFDSYGECIGKEEKWAFKKGHDQNGSEWTEKWNEFPNRKTAEKIGSNQDGDEWKEQWVEEYSPDGTAYKWAEKTGKNALGDEWTEFWEERNDMKYAKKTGSNPSGDHWEEQWQETEHSNGSGEKWTSKWTADNQGNRHGTSWGDRWGIEGKGGHRWGEEWANGDVRKWWHDTPGRPPGC